MPHRPAWGEPQAPGPWPSPRAPWAVYFDDILVFSPTKEQHLLRVAETLEILRRNQLYAKRSKCEFGRTELTFLGHVLSKDGVKVDPRKTAAVRAWATPS